MASSREENYQAKQEGGDNSTNNIEKNSKASSSTSRQWSTSSLRNPRIVRVSRTFGGKDRHSKVCTIRGLRDRRIRLSVPTAIQLYDLQDKLGLGQPSKVIDWLLEATKFDIDKLPPLQFPQSFSQFHPLHPQTLFPFHDQSSNNIASHQLSLGPLYDPNSTFVGIQNLMARSKFWDIDSRVKGKEVEREYFSEKGKWIKTNEEENQVGEASYSNFHQDSTQKLFPMETHSNFLNNSMSYNNYHSEASSLSLSQFGSSHGLFQSHQQIDPNNQSNGNGLQFPFSLPNSQLLFGPSSSTTPSSSLFSTPFMNNQVENDPRIQFNHFQFINSSSSQTIPHPLIPSFHHSFNSPPIRPFPVPFSSKLLDSDNTDNSNQPDDNRSSTRHS